MSPIALDKDDANTWKAIMARMHGAATATFTTLQAALWPDDHVIYDVRVHAAANGSRLAGELPTTPDVDASRTGSGEPDLETYAVVRDWIRKTADAEDVSATEIERALYRLDQRIESDATRTWGDYAEALVREIESSQAPQGKAGVVSDRYRTFWSQYLGRVSALHPEWPGVGQPTSDNYLYQSSGSRDCRIAPGFKRDGRVSHELVIMSTDADRNRELFNALAAHRQEFEDAYGRPVTWDERAGAKRCLIGEYRPGSLTGDPDDSDRHIDWFIDCGERSDRPSLRSEARSDPDRNTLPLVSGRGLTS